MLDKLKKKINGFIDKRIDSKLSLLPTSSKKEKKDALTEVTEGAQETTLTPEQAAKFLAKSFQRTENDFKIVNKKGDTVAMDSDIGIKQNKMYGLMGVGQDKIYTFFSQHSFIGWQLCAMIAQHWLVNNACTIPCADAIRPGWKNTFAIQPTETNKDNRKQKEELLTELYSKTNKKYDLTNKCVQFARNMKIFGVGYALLCVDGIDLSKPFNIDGVKPGNFKGISIIDPYWIMPQWSINSLSNPATPNFYEPEYYTLPGGLKVHRSHIIKVVNAEVPDILKPSYYFGGVPLTQMIYERVYASEKVANEAPMLALTKRMLVVDSTNLSNLLANPDAAQQNIVKLTKFRDNFGVYFKEEGQEVKQIDTTLTDFDELIMTQYQLVAAVARVPADKLLETSPKGLNNTGEFNNKNYTQDLQSLQTNVYTPLIERVNSLCLRSDFGVKADTNIDFNPVDMPTEKEVAEVNEIKSRTASNYVSAGVLSPEEIRSELSADPSSGFSNLSEETPEPFDEEQYLNDIKNPKDGEKKDGQDAAFNEGDHPRDKDGKFSSGNSNREGGRQYSSKPLSEFLGREYKGIKGRDAINKLYQEKQGHIKAAFSREDLGDISLVWGDEEKGLCHLIKRREKQGISAKEFLSDLTDVIEKGTSYPNKYTASRRDIWYQDKLVVLETEYVGEKFNWVVTELRQKNEPKR